MRALLDARGVRGSPVARRLVAASFGRPRAALGAWAVLVLLAVPGIARLQFETAAGSLLNRTGGAWEFYRESLSLFGGDEIVVVALASERPFDVQVLREIAAISDEIESLPGVRRVDSLSTVPIVRVLGGADLRLDPAVDGAPLRTLRDADRVREVVAADRIAPRSLVSEDGRVFAVNVLLEDADEIDRAGTVAGIEAVLGDRDLGEHWVSGVPVFETHIGPETQREIARFVPATLVLMAAILWALFRSLAAVAIPLLSGAVGTLLVLGAMGALGEPLTILGVLLPSVLLALGCAYSMHLITAARGCAGVEERLAAIEASAPAIALSGLTTALGFFAMSGVEIDAIRALGAYGGLGVIFVLAATLTLAPAMLRLVPIAARGSRLDIAFRRRLGDGLVGRVQRHRRAISIGWLACSGLAVAGLARLEIETDATRWWPRGSPVREDYEAIRERLSGISPMNVVLTARAGRSVTDADVAERIDALSAFLDGLPDVGKAISLADPLRQLNSGFTRDRASPMPASSALIEQYLLLLESVDHVEDLVTDDRSAANVLLRVDDNGSRHLLGVARAAERWWSEFGSTGVSARATGIMYEFARAEDEIARGQLWGLGLALAAIGSILFALFRAPLVVGVALLPNVLPLVVVMGALGVAAIPLDAGTACVGSMALGIAVDDTLHVMLGYRELRRGGDTARAALSHAYQRVLPALFSTTLVIAVGFGVIGLSEFTLTRSLGAVTAALVVLCLLADVSLLPALLLGREREAQAGH